MSARILCFGSAKGGSGKTSLVATFATFLSKLSKKTLLVDSDLATNGLTLLFLKEVRVTSELVRSTRKSPRGLFDALFESATPDIVQLADALHLIPASFTLHNDSTSIPEAKARDAFKEMLTSLREEYDYIFIDAQAGADEMGRVAMSRDVSDEVVLVSEYDPMSAAGVERLKALLRDDLTYDRTWVLLNKILPEFAKSFSDFMEVAKYLSPIPWDAEVVRAYARRQLAINTETGNDYTIAVMHTIRGLCGESIKKELAEWLESRAAIIRQPLQQQYSDAEKEYEFLLRSEFDAKQASRAIKSFRMFAIAMTAMILFGSLGFFSALVTQGKYLFELPTSIATVAAVATSLLAISFAATRTTISSKRSVEQQVLAARRERQLQVVHERLKRLEFLKTLDPETLLGHSDIRYSSGKSAPG